MYHRTDEYDAAFSKFAYCARDALPASVLSLVEKDPLSNCCTAGAVAGAQLGAGARRSRTEHR